MHATRWLWLYRPTLPSARAQSLQILHAACAMAGTGADVTVLAERSGEVSAAEVLAWAGLAPQPRLDLRLLRGGRTVSSLHYRLAVMRWARLGPGTVLVRRKRHLLALRRWLPAHIRVIVEAHEVARCVAQDAGFAGLSEQTVEREALRWSHGVVCNAPGTARLLQESHAVLPPLLVAPNASRSDRCVPREGSQDEALYLGSAHAWKGLMVAAEGAERAGVRLRVVGPMGQGSERLTQVGSVTVDAPISPREVPAALQRAGTFVLPASDTWFGRELTSPLKGWDYRAAGRPIVGADTPAVRAVAGPALVPYALDDVAQAAAAFVAARDHNALRDRAWQARVLRSWSDRAAEIRAFAEAL